MCKQFYSGFIDKKLLPSQVFRGKTMKVKLAKSMGAINVNKGEGLCLRGMIKSASLIL